MIADGESLDRGIHLINCLDKRYLKMKPRRRNCLRRAECTYNSLFFLLNRVIGFAHQHQQNHNDCYNLGSQFPFSFIRILKFMKCYVSILPCAEHIFLHFPADCKKITDITCTLAAYSTTKYNTWAHSA